MAMIKEKQKDKCGSANKKGRNNSGSTTVATANSIAAITITSAPGTTSTTITTTTPTVTSADVSLLKNECLENDIEIKDESFGSIGEEIMEKVSSNSSPAPIACSFVDSNKFAMDMCPVDGEFPFKKFYAIMTYASNDFTESLIEHFSCTVETNFGYNAVSFRLKVKTIRHHMISSSEFYLTIIFPTNAFAYSR